MIKLSILPNHVESKIKLISKLKLNYFFYFSSDAKRYIPKFFYDANEPNENSDGAFSCYLKTLKRCTDRGMKIQPLYLQRTKKSY